MKKIKLRFVRVGDIYYAQKKTFFGWRYVTYHFKVEGLEHEVSYFSFDKDELLEEIVKEHYGLSMDRANVTVYPEIIKKI